jgi:S-formylglutathione hydrolase FrmB
MKKNLLFLCIIVFTTLNLYSRQDDSLKSTEFIQIQNSAEKCNFKIRFSFTEEVSKTPISGRIIVGFNSDTSTYLKNPDLIDRQPTFALDVNDWIPGEKIILDCSNAICWEGYPDSLEGWYLVQALIKTNKKARTVRGTGNAVTEKRIVYIEKGKMKVPLDLSFCTVWKGPKKFKETEFVKEVNVKSELLTNFYGEPDSIQAAIILPSSYFIENNKIYPSVYVMGGWGSSHFDALYDEPQKRYGMSGFGEEKIFIFVNHECGTGYHVFCNSETNGPREETFLQELIPCIEKKFRVNKNPQTRFLMGQSSGAWAGLWLVINYPGLFGGAYVASPDPVDFKDFIGTNIYEKDANMFYDSKGNIKFLINDTSGSLPLVTVKDFTGIDLIAGWGEQIYSFDATFSKRNSSGEPFHLYDWNTGEVNPEVAAYWENHDLSKVVSKLSPEKINLLNGKIHIYVAEDDIFGLNRPVRTFQNILNKQGIEADIRFLTSGGHDVWTDEIRKLIHYDIDRITGSIRN